MRSIRTIQCLSCAAVLAAGTVTLIPTTARAAVACSQTALVAAINAANAAHGGNVVLTPGCTYTLTASHARGSFCLTAWIESTMGRKPISRTCTVAARTR